MATMSSPRRRERVVERDSVLRASILDTALELGVGDSSTVARWMFNPVQEVDEDVESMVSPSLTYASTATSEESASFGSNFRHHRPGADTSLSNSVSSQTHSLAKSDSPHSDGLAYSRNNGLTPEPHGHRAIHFDLSQTPEPRVPSPMPTPSKGGKLRKARPDGYESDGGYVSDGTKGKKEKKDKEKKEKKSKKKVKEDGNAPGEESDGGYLSEISLRRRKKDKKPKKDRSELDKSMTDGESDGGYMSSMSFGRSKKDRAAKAAAITSPGTGDESDGAYLSESSVKKRSKFFRLNTKSSRKKNNASHSPAEVVPPVPSLPPMQLKIADMFAKSATSFDADDSRAVTPVPNEQFISPQSIHSESISSMASVQPSPSLVSVQSSLDSPLDPPRAIPNAFMDAESIRTPSTDLLATFGRRQLPQVQSPTRAKGPSLDTVSTTSSSLDSPISAGHKPASSPLRIPSVPTISMPKPKRNPSMKTTPPQISAPNTRALAAAKHTPVPLILTPPTPGANARAFGAHPPAQASTPGSDGTPHTAEALSPWNRNPDVPRSPSLSIASSTASAGPPLPSPTTPNGVRPHVLAYYDLPPPSPPPSGPLPRVPPPPEQRTSRHEWSQPHRAPSPIWKTDMSPGGPNSAGRSQQPSAPPSPLFLQRTPANPRGRESPFPGGSPSSSDEPLTRTTSNQRGRESPFPTQPVLPREESSELVRKTSIARANSPTKMGATRPLRIGTKNVNISGPMGPMSADPFAAQSRLAPQQTLDAHWQPRSASALDTRGSNDSRRSWIDYDDATLDSLDSRRTSSDEQDLSQEGSVSVYNDDELGPNGSGGYTRPSPLDPDSESRSTLFYDAENSDGEEEEAGSRYSVWSAKSRASIMDKERSNDVRQKFVRRVEAMYGKSPVPPVPKLPPPSKPGMF
ncbi:hypothetical protein EIP91_000188 [Steccherinum ochraceum]|uniref:Uncharacterized protein n=1 Tax=Steccherinum ochraceum TaxID=92696 RepID=A0A4R0S384_9APHY|nr:hypothetical protein EIP91_000188 [Steccherinum ochraceum]